jgi:BCD family chlorophyll transporter-like MFS transporter
MPFRDLGGDVPLPRLFRLSLFQLSVGLAQTMFFGTLNRVMIVELGIPASIIATMIAIPLLIAPFRALIGHQSDTHRSVFGWRRVPFIWGGTLMQFAGLSIMPFALLILSGDQVWGPRWIAYGGAALAFLLVGSGAHTVQTAGLALATDLADEEKRPQVVGLMYVMMLVGAVASAFLLGAMLSPYSPLKLIQVIQGCALFAVVANAIALWKQEARQPGVVPYAKGEARPRFREAWSTFTEGGQAVRLLVVTALGIFAFNLQDVLLEPYGGQVLGMGVGETTALTGIYASGAIVAFMMAPTMLGLRVGQVSLLGVGSVLGVAGFLLVLVSVTVALPEAPFRIGTFLVGMGEGLFSVGTMHLAMSLKDSSQHGIALGAWGAVAATSEGLALAVSGFARDGLDVLVSRGALLATWRGPAVSYNLVYGAEVLLLLLTLASLPWLVRKVRREDVVRRDLALADLPA